jgi:hypothetical protein
MQKQSTTYAAMDWVDALKAKKGDGEKYTPASSNGPEVIDNVVERTMEAAFGLPTTEKTSKQTISEASQRIADRKAEEGLARQSQEIKNKLAVSGIDPSTLGLTVDGKPLTKEDWEKASDPVWTETVAKKAAIEFEKQSRNSWQARAMQPQQYSKVFDIERPMGGRVAPGGGHVPEVPQRTEVPANAASIFDPKRLDKMASEPNAHDESVKASKARHEELEHARANAAKEQFEEIARKQAANPAMRYTGGIIPAGNQETSEFVHRAPSNQISISDHVETLSPEELKQKLSNMFGRVADTRTDIREANQKRQEAIQGKKDKDRSWEKVSKPTSTAEIRDRLLNLWLPEKP